MSTSPIGGGASTPLVSLEDPLVGVPGTPDSSGSTSDSFIDLSFLKTTYNPLLGLGAARSDTSTLSAEVLAELDLLRLDSANASISGLLSRIQAAIRDGSEASAQLSDIETQVTAIGNERDNLAAQKDDLTAQKNALVTQKNSLAAERTGKQSELGGKQSELDDLNSEIAGEQAVINAQGALIQQINAQIADLNADGEPGEHADEITTLETQRDAAVALRNTATANHATLTGQKQTLQQETSALNTQISSLTSAIAAKDQQLAAKNQELAAKNQELAAKDQELAAKTEEFEALLEQNPVTSSNTAVAQAQRLAASTSMELSLDNVAFENLRTEFGRNQRATGNPVRWTQSPEEREASIQDNEVKRVPSAYGKAKSPDEARHEAERLALPVVAVVQALDLLAAGVPDQQEPKRQKFPL